MVFATGFFVSPSSTSITTEPITWSSGPAAIAALPSRPSVMSRAMSSATERAVATFIASLPSSPSSVYQISNTSASRQIPSSSSRKRPVRSTFASTGL